MNMEPAESHFDRRVHVKPFPYYPLRIILDTPLHNSATPEGTDLTSLIITAIKFFLFQRNQIPVPFDQIHNATLPLAPRGTGMRNTTGPGQTEEVEAVCNGIDRIRQLRNQRREKAKHKQLSNKIRKQMHDEVKIRNCWDHIFQILQTLVIHEAENLVAFILMFGQTLRNPRETVLFQFNPNVLRCQPSTKNAGMCVTGSTGSHSSAIRKIFKGLIMSAVFPEFTSKPLQKTNTHICLLTKTPIPESSLLHSDLIKLNEFVIPGNGVMNGTNTNYFKPMFHVNFSLDGDESITTEGTESGEFEFDLFNNNTFSCYQIPIQFRGIQWRQK